VAYKYDYSAFEEGIRAGVERAPRAGRKASFERSLKAWAKLPRQSGVRLHPERSVDAASGFAYRRLMLYRSVRWIGVGVGFGNGFEHVPIAIGPPRRDREKKSWSPAERSATGSGRVKPDFRHRLLRFRIFHERLPQEAGALIFCHQQTNPKVDAEHVTVPPAGKRIEGVNKAVP
jgi:hypothetical protein